MGKWVTVSEACNILKLKERTLRYRIAKNTIQSKLENNKRFVYIEENDEALHETLHETSNSLHANFEEGLIAHKEIMKEKDLRIENLQQQIEVLQKQIDERNNFINQESEKHNTQMHALTEQIDHLHQIVAMQQKTIESVTEKNNLLLESKTRSFWGRLIGSFGN